MNDKMMGAIGEEISYVQRNCGKWMNGIYSWGLGMSKFDEAKCE
jgi:hypothetical protein